MCAEPSQTPPASASSSDALKSSGATDSPTTVQLVVSTGDAAAEIFVVDAQLRLCDRGIGKLESWLAPGIYKVKVRTGLSTQEEYVVLRDVPVQKAFLPLSFSTPVPLVNTAKSHEYHQQAAVDQSQQIHVRAGQGSTIFVFARDWTPLSEVKPASARSWTHPGAGLKLKSMSGAVIADIEQDSVTSLQMDPDRSHDSWAACTIEVDPGAYRLSVQTPDGEFEQTIVAPPNWHVHVFLLQHAYGVDQKDEDSQVQTRSDLAGAAIMLSQAQKFTPNGDEARLVELARLGLMERRKVLSVELRQMMALKFTDPMLGIFAGHLILADPSPDLDLLSTVVGNLRSLLQYPHPDVEALALKLANGPVLEVSVPPMLRRSWSIILDASVDETASVTRGSMAADIIGRISAVDPWLIWSQPATTQADREEHEVQDSVFKQALGDHLAHARKSGSDAWKVTKSVHFLGAKFDPPALLLPRTKSVTEGQVKQLIHALGVPRFYVEDLLKDSGFTLPEK
jgi:hypothetical protein